MAGIKMKSVRYNASQRAKAPRCDANRLLAERVVFVEALSAVGCARCGLNG
jgi:hypothetical protein